MSDVAKTMRKLIEDHCERQIDVGNREQTQPALENRRDGATSIATHRFDALGVKLADCTTSNDQTVVV